LSNKNKRITILYIDQAVAFGGSLVVLGGVVDVIDKNRFRPLVIGEVESSILEHQIKNAAEVFIIPHAFNYVMWARATDTIRGIYGKVTGKLAIYGLSLVRSIINTLYLIRISGLIIRKHVDIVHANNGMSNVEAIIAAIILRRRLVVHLHGLSRPGKIQSLLARMVHRFVAVSEYVKDSLAGDYISADRIQVIRNPVRISPVSKSAVASMRGKYHILPGEKLFGIAGRIVRWKGHIEFLNAALLVLGRVPDSRVIIIGDFADGDRAYQDKIVSMIRESGFEERILLAGYVEDMVTYYSALDVLVHTSIQPEPFGMVITEAMACGVPVVASDRGAPGEIIRDGVNGFLVDPDNKDALAETIVGLLEDDELRQGIGRKGKAWVQESYNLQEYGFAMEEVYRGVLGGAGPETG